MTIKRFFAVTLALCLLALCVPAPGALAGSKYEIWVDLTNQITTVYESGKVNDSEIVRQMICSSGKSATPTPVGVFYLPSRSRSDERSEWYYFPKYKCYAKWATRIRGGILFHSVTYSASKRGPISGSVRALGSKASHGCIRLRVDDAKWIAKNCPAGTKVKIYSSGKLNSSLRAQLKKKTYIRGDQADTSTQTTVTTRKLLLKKGSKGALVTQLQTRLKALGFFAGKVNGKVGNTTVTAWKRFETASGLRKTAKLDQAVWDKIFASNAATGTLVTLTSSSSGPAVKVMQQNLITLLMLSGSADGSFGSLTAAAVKQYQSSFGFAVTGSADGELQRDIASRAAQVRKDFGGGDYAIKTNTVDAQMARVKKRAGTKLFSAASSRANSIKKLSRNTILRVLDAGKTWIKVQQGVNVGFVKRSALKFYTDKVTDTTYVKVDPTPTPPPTSTPTPTPTPTVSLPTPTPTVSLPTPTPSPVVSLPTQSSDTISAASLPQAVALADGTPFYAEKDPATLQGTVPAGSAFDVVDSGNGWVTVLLGDATGYVRVESVQLIDGAPLAEIPTEVPAEPVSAETSEEDVELEPEGEELIFGTEAVDEVETESGDGLEIETEEMPETSFDLEIDESGTEEGLEISED